MFGFIVNVAALLFFWLMSASTALQACCQLFVCPCRTDHVVLDRRTWKLTFRSIARIRSSARTHRFSSSGCDPTRHQSPLSVIAGGVSVESQASHKSQWSEIACEGADFLFNLVVGFAIGVCTFVILGYTYRLFFSRYCRSRRTDQIVARD